MDSSNDNDISDHISSVINQFLPLLTMNHHRIYGYILSLLPVRADADDIMQEATLIMWKKFADFKPGTDFVSWGIAIARNLLLNYRKNKYYKVLHLNDEAVKMIEAKSESFIQEVDRRMDVLKQCVKKLPGRDRLLIRLRHEYEMPVKIIAERLGKNIKTIYKSLARIQDALARCIRRTLVAEEWR
ncbi:MAG: sigma-70 family RNA polymerase sigma factor [Sedimentisphaerales bacterium]|nr:sigma-70 family RNA polymerase sigma factor [Sedimentisphaerales bacterium]